MQITVYKAPVTTTVYVQPARNGAEIIDRIRDASASVADIRRFLRVLGDKLTRDDFPVVSYALARARYREGGNLDIQQLALLCELSVAKAKHYLRKVRKSDHCDNITPIEASAVMSSIADY
jgi:hypothetical protein